MHGFISFSGLMILCSPEMLNFGFFMSVIISFLLTSSIYGLLKYIHYTTFLAEFLIGFYCKVIFYIIKFIFYCCNVEYKQI